jgi:hypothetical protein
MLDVFIDPENRPDAVSRLVIVFYTSGDFVSKPVDKFFVENSAHVAAGHGLSQSWQDCADLRVILIERSTTLDQANRIRIAEGL